MGATPLRFAIAGCGKIAQRHAEHISNCGVLVATCDIVPAKAEKLALAYKAKSFFALQDMLAHSKDYDVLVVCTPNGLHAEHTIAGLRAGVHVLCEKPMAIAVADAGAMMLAAQETGKRIFIVKQNRFNPPVSIVKSLLQENKLGKIYSAQLNCFWNRDANYYADSWRGTKHLDGGTLFTQFSHFIDLLYYFFGNMLSAEGILSNRAHKGIIDFEDTGIVSMVFEHDVMAGLHYTVNSYKKNMEGSLTITGEKGTVKIGGAYLNTLDYQCIDGIAIENIPASGPANDYGGYTGSMSNHDKVYENLIAVLQNGAVAYANDEDGFKTVDIIERIYKACRIV